MKCPKCNFDGNPNLEETGPHTKATCSKCGTYIKMVSNKELDRIIKETTDKPEVLVADKETTLIIKTSAPKEYMPAVLKRVTLNVSDGYICGEGTIFRRSDNMPYRYEFYYE